VGVWCDRIGGKRERFFLRGGGDGEPGGLSEKGEKEIKGGRNSHLGPRFGGREKEFFRRLKMRLMWEGGRQNC